MKQEQSCSRLMADRMVAAGATLSMAFRIAQRSKGSIALTRHFQLP